MINSNLILAIRFLGLYIVLGLLIIFATIFLILVPLKVWFRAFVSGCWIPMQKLIGMNFRKLDCKLIVDNYILAKKAGLKIKISDLEAHLMSKGNLNKLVEAMIASKSAQIPLTLEQAMAIDLSDKDVVEAIQTCIKPKIIKTPETQAMAKNGIGVKLVAQITIKGKIDKMVGFATEDTIISRVVEAIVSAVGMAESHTDILSNPAIVSRPVLAKNLDQDTCYEILSIDISDLDIGDNIGGNTKIMEAETRKKIAQAQAEERKAQAIAHEQEMKAKTQEMKAIVLAAETQVHRAMAKVLNKGKLTAMEYFKLQNIMADTNMRNSFVKSKEGQDRSNRG